MNDSTILAIQARCRPRLAFLLTAFLWLSACAVTPDAPLTVHPDAGPIDVSAKTFSTEVFPVPGRTGFLRRVEATIINGMESSGYRRRAQAADLQIEIRLQRTDPSTLLSQPVHTGRLWLRLKAGNQILRDGYTGSLSEIELDFLSDEQIAQRVHIFLQGLPRAPVR